MGTFLKHMGTQKHSGNKNKKIALTLAVLLLLALAVWIVYQIVNREKIIVNAAFVIDGRAYSKESVKKDIAYPVSKGKKESEAAKQLFEFEKRRAAAKKSGVSVSDDEINKSIKLLYPQYSQNKSVENNMERWVKLEAYDYALGQELKNEGVNQLKHIKGYIFFFNFSDKIATNDNLDYRPDGYGEPLAIQKDKNYAKSAVEKYHKKLKNSEITADQALKEIKADRLLSMVQAADMNQSMKFENFDMVSARNYIPDSVVSAFKANPPQPGLGDIEIGSIATTPKPRQDSDYQDAYYYFTYINNDQKILMTDFSTVYNNLEAQYWGVK